MNKHPLFNNIYLKEYEKQLITKKFKTNQLIFSEGETCDYLGVIISGELTISTITNKDNEYVINVLGKNDIFGENLLFNTNNHFLGDGIITKDSEIIFIQKEVLLEMFSNKTFLLNYLSLTSTKNSNVRQRLKLLSQKTIEDRIMFYLSTEQKRLGTNIIPITSKEKLATTLNIPRPSLSRELKNLKGKGLIEYNRYFIKLML
jgi:CRP-like cAMP-binding protein